jgi:hypothetical protein
MKLLVGLVQRSQLPFRFRACFGRTLCALGSLLLLGSLSTCHTQSGPLHFLVKVPSELGPRPQGRLIVLLSPEKELQEELKPGMGENISSVWIAAEEVRNLHPGESLDSNPDRLAYPTPLSQAPPGN